MVVKITSSGRWSRFPTSADTVDVEAGLAPRQFLCRHLRQMRRVLIVTRPYPPVNFIHTLTNIICGLALPIAVMAGVFMYYTYSTPLVPSSCPTRVDLDLQLPCVPETLSFEDVQVFNTHDQPKDRQCLASPVQTLPQPQPCGNKTKNGDNKVACFVQKVTYQKWIVFETVVITVDAMGSFNKFYSVADMQRMYSYSCKDPVDDKQPRTSYKEPLELLERVRTVRDFLSHLKSQKKNKKQ